MLDNQNMSDELALQSARLESLVHDNEALMNDKAHLRREVRAYSASSAHAHTGPLTRSRCSDFI